MVTQSATRFATSFTRSAYLICPAGLGALLVPGLGSSGGIHSTSGRCDAPGVDTVTLTRDELYSLVWSKPMTAVADEFGVSSVAFAKYCVKLAIPRPSRGYWQQLAAGLKPRCDKLPKAGPRTPATITLAKYQRTRTKVRDRPTPPAVAVAARLTRPHPAVEQIRDRIRPLRPDEHHMSGVRGDGRAVFKVGKSSERRGLMLLDATCKALTARGHQVELRECSHIGRNRHALEVAIVDERVEFWLVEHADRSAHVPTAKEQEDYAKYRWRTPQKYDFAPSGRLALEATWTHEEGLRRRWSDGPKQRLEALLGDIVVGLEAIGAALAEQREQREEQERAEQRRRDQEERDRRRAAEQRALATHLVETASRWREAEVVRDFLSAIAERVPKGSRSVAFTRWFAWARQYVEQHDPLTDPERIPRPPEEES